MNAHLTVEELQRYADGELSADAVSSAEIHLRECSRCSGAVLASLQLKQAVREAHPRYPAPPVRVARSSDGTRFAIEAPPRRVHPVWWAVAAAVLVLILGSSVVVAGARRAAARELVDLHTTLIGGASPVDVLSSDRHTVKPWFEGRVPFAVNVPELQTTPFRLTGGRVVYWRGRPAAYLLLTKGAHRLSMFIYDGPPPAGAPSLMTVRSWRANGLTHVIVADLSAADVEILRSAWKD